MTYQSILIVFRACDAHQHEYLIGQVVFALHPVCDAKYHLENSSLNAPFQMKNLEENVSYLEYTSPTSIINPSFL